MKQDEQGGIEELVRVLVAEKFDELKTSFAIEIGATFRTVLTESEILRTPDLAQVLEDIEILKKKVVGLDLDRFAHDIDLLKKQTITKEGVRKKLDIFTQKTLEVESKLSSLRTELENSGILEDEHRDYHMHKGKQDADFAHSELEEFRASMRPGWPVHLGGLSGRADLNLKAGLLQELHGSKGRWAVLVGDEVVLVKPENLFP